MKKDFVDLTPRELNAYLKERCGIDIYQFSVLALEIFKWKRIYPNIKSIPDIQNSDLWPKDYLDKPQYCVRISNSAFTSPQFLFGLKKRLLNLEKKLISTMIEFEYVYYGKPKPKKEEIETSNLYRFELGDFISRLHYYENTIQELLDQRKIGAPVNRRNLLCACWALFLHEQKIKVDWSLFSDLLEWFWKRLEPYSLYRDFKPSKGEADPEYLKNQFFKQKKRWIKYYDAIRPLAHMEIDKGVGGGKVIVFGRNHNDLGSTYAYKIELSLRGIPKLPNTEPWKIVHNIYSTRARYPRQKHAQENTETNNKAFESANRANLNWLIVFPDGTYAIAPE